MRAVQCQYFPIVHLDIGETKAKCGIIPYRKAVPVIYRDLMCMNCFGQDHGQDHGVGKITALMIGVDKIYERKTVTEDQARRLHRKA